MSFQNRINARLSGASFIPSLVTALALSAVFAAHAQTPEESSKKQGAALSRAEVVADLVLWRRAGVDRYAVMQSYSLETQAYQTAYQEYLRLRNSEQFQAEVQKALKD
ncbi:DUF4148 domain-containing protein [Acidovorax sp. 106]|uniref:DUF4148 domain-containing protein n=1 Tax=Acidovorax sp. 106 TaxID=2135637 RepID=UPI000EB021F8|nr:DUF4148 domain-containing protein [Acidovorax sp. 106]RLJ38116.1 uncharacterized protein DUF4148 [Acidovorax sp. 106]